MCLTLNRSSSNTHNYRKIFGEKMSEIEDRKFVAKKIQDLQMFKLNLIQYVNEAIIKLEKILTEK